MLGEILGKLITAPIKIVAMPLLVIRDIAESNPNEGLIETVTESIERQAKDIVE